MPKPISRRDAMKLAGATALGIAGCSLADEPHAHHAAMAAMGNLGAAKDGK